MSEAVAEDGSRLTLYPDTDNWSALQTFLDAHSSILLPPGVWNVTRPLNLRTGHELTGNGVEATTIKQIGAWAGPTIGIGGAGRWAGSESYGQANNVQLRGFTVWQTVLASGANCIMNNDGDDFRAEEMRVRGSYFEGIIGGSNCMRCTLKDFEAIDCGNGAPHGSGLYEGSTAGINCTCIDLLMEDFRTTGCGQGVETGNTRVTVRRGVIVAPGTGTPSRGISIGSSVYGVYQTTVEDCIVDGYLEAITVANVIGRIAAVTIRRNILRLTVPGSVGVSFQGGALNNSVGHPDEGPTTEGSEITDNILYVYKPCDSQIGYNSGSSDNDGLYGREPLTVSGNTIYFSHPDAYAQGGPIFSFAGEIPATVQVNNNIVWGSPAAPARGDLQTFSFGSNQAIPAMPNLSYTGNRSYKPDLMMRDWVRNIEGA